MSQARRSPSGPIIVPVWAVGPVPTGTPLLPQFLQPAPGCHLGNVDQLTVHASPGHLAREGAPLGTDWALGWTSLVMGRPFSLGHRRGWALSLTVGCTQDTHICLHGCWCSLKTAHSAGWFPLPSQFLLLDLSHLLPAQFGSAPSSSWVNRATLCLCSERSLLHFSLSATARKALLLTLTGRLACPSDKGTQNSLFVPCTRIVSFPSQIGSFPLLRKPGPWKREGESKSSFPQQDSVLSTVMGPTPGTG